MKFNYKLNLGNVVGAVINSVPEMASKVDISKLSDMTIEGSAEYTVTEAVAIINETKKLIVELPDLIGIAVVKMRSVFDLIEELDAEDECDGDCEHCGVPEGKEDVTILATTEEGTREVSAVEAIKLAAEANHELSTLLEIEKEENAALKDVILGLKVRLYGPESKRAQKISLDKR